MGRRLRRLQLEIRTGRPVTLATNGMVTSPHSLASAAGVDVLRAGGSAIDAAIATARCSRWSIRT